VSDEHAIRDAAAAGRLGDAATLGLGLYGGELLGYLVAIARDEVAAGEVFSMLAEDLWRGLAKFRWECTFRTWAYGLARSALSRYRRDAYRRRAVALEDSPYAEQVAKLRSTTATYLRTETKDKIARLRAELEPDDQTLLILRINRNLGWREIARVFAEADGEGDVELDRRAAALRKRFERLKTEIKKRASATD
jgi:RNA polymerase sigma-70 factor (ECF subfamily)